MIYKGIFKESKSLIIEDNQYRIVILPDIGGKIASIYNKNKDFELLFQNQNEVYKKANLNDNFGEFDASGFDDAFPTIDTSIVKYEGREVTYPDHGEVWSSSMGYEVIEGDKLKLSFTSKILPYKYEKTLSLEEEGLKLQYNIVNIGREAFPCIWAMHCLVNCEKDMKIVFPKGTNKVLNVHKSSRLGEVETKHNYPLTKDLDGNDYRLDRILDYSANHTEKYYVDGIVKDNKCSIHYPSKDVTYEVIFDKEKMPYIGFWVTEGGFRGDYNCALEPTNGYYDSIDIAQKNNGIYYLQPDSVLNFEITISVK